MMQKKYVIHPASQPQKAVNPYPPNKQKQDCGCSKKKKQY